MQKFQNKEYALIDKNGNAVMGKQGIRSYKTRERAEREMESAPYLRNCGYRVVKIGFEEVQ